MTTRGHSKVLNGLHGTRFGLLRALTRVFRLALTRRRSQVRNLERPRGKHARQRPYCAPAEPSVLDRVRIPQASFLVYRCRSGHRPFIARVSGGISPPEPKEGFSWPSTCCPCIASRAKLAPR